MIRIKMENNFSSTKEISKNMEKSIKESSNLITSLPMNQWKMLYALVQKKMEKCLFF